MITAMKQALEALGDNLQLLGHGPIREATGLAIAKLDQAIEQAERVEPVAWARYPRYTGSAQKPEVVFATPEGSDWVELFASPPTAPAQQPLTLTTQAWECNECGSQEYSTCLSEHDVHELGCGKCGASEWHLADIKGASL